MRNSVVRPLVFLFPALLSPATDAADNALELRPGDRICLIGNALAERMQYFGYFETLLHRHFSSHKLAVRNLAYSGDEVRFRPRSLDFGTPDQHLSMQKADVILAFFGFNESFHGPEGLATFERELNDFVRHTLQRKYNGESAPRLALISPIAHEATQNTHLPTGETTNRNLQLYTEVIERVAHRHGVQFANLFRLSLILFDSELENLTFNGVHLKEDGYRRLAPILMQRLFGESPSWSRTMEPLRAEVNEKCFQFFHRYRAVNGYYIYGGRSQRDHGNPPYTDAYVIENERDKLDEMTAIRDARIWRLAQGAPVSDEIDDSGTRPLYDVPTNFKQPVRILPPEDAIEEFVLADGYEVNLFASETDFPSLKNPVQMTFDLEGRCWVATMPSYPQYLPPHRPDDRILVLEDTDHDGRADKQTVFADGLYLPTGFELGDGGVYVAQEPNLMHIQDVDGDLIGDQRKLLLHGFDSADSHHAIGAFVWGPGGGLYLHEGTFHVTQVETPYGPVRNAHGAVYRYEPTREKFETFVHYNFANPWGTVFDTWGQTFVADASGGRNYFGTAFSTKAPQYTGQPDFGPFQHVYQETMKEWFPMRVRPTSGCEFVSSRHFPKEAQGNYLLNNVIGFQGVLQHTLQDEGSGFQGKEIEPIIYSRDRNFRPVDLEFGGDGALYVVDWFNPLIGHMQHSLRDPNRDTTHGRIWRITARGRKLLSPPAVARDDLAGLVALLDEPEDRVRYRARLRLREHDTRAVVDAMKGWVAGLDQGDPRLEHHLLETLWVLQHHDAVAHSDPYVRQVAAYLLQNRLKSDDPRVRAAATRVLCYWRHGINEALRLLGPESDVSAIDLLRTAVHDDHPRVRLEAVRACSFFEDPQAAEIALEVLMYPTDYYIDYTLRHTMRRQEPFWMPSLGAGQPFAVGNDAGLKYITSRVATPDLLGMARSKPVYQELLSRDGIVFQYRVEAINSLAQLNGTDAVAEILRALDRLDSSQREHADRVIAQLTHLVSMQTPNALKQHREQIVQLSEGAQRTITRQVATAALIAADGTVDEIWQKAVTDATCLNDFVNVVPLIHNPSVRDSVYDRVHDLLTALPEPLASRLEVETTGSIRRSASLALASIPGHDLESFRSLRPMIARLGDRSAAVKAAQRLSLSEIPPEETRSVIQQLVDWVQSVDPKNRTQDDVVNAVQLLRDLSAGLPRNEAIDLRRKLSDLAIDIFVIRPVPHRMQFDRTDLYVQAGRAFEIVLENTDIMPHNLVVTLPDSREHVGILAERMGASPDAFAKQFIPDSNRVLEATRMLQPGQSERLQLTAPAEPTSYQYVCTFPGHWRTMWGTLHVVRDISEISLEKTRTSLDDTAHHHRGLVRQRQFIRKWTLDDLLPALDALRDRSSRKQGEDLFQDVSCAQCHQMNGQGGTLGPDLTDISRKMAEKKLKISDLLNSILTPSKDIEEKYRTQIIVDVDGRALSGVVVEETPDSIRLAVSPLERDTKVVTIARDEIDERESSKISIMPEGLLNTMTREEVLDLLAWIVSVGGNG